MTAPGVVCEDLYNAAIEIVTKAGFADRFMGCLLYTSTSGGGCSDGTVAQSTGSACHYQRHESAYKCKGGHQDGTQTAYGTSNGSIKNAHALLAVLIGHFHNKNGIFT